MLVEGVRAGREDTGTRDSGEGERGQFGSRRRHQGGTLRRGPSSRLVRLRALGHPPQSLPLQVSTLLARYVIAILLLMIDVLLTFIQCQ